MVSAWPRENMGIATFPLMEQGIDGFLDFAASLGLRYVEIRNERPYALPQDMRLGEMEHLKDRLAALRLEPIIHAAVYDINIASLNPLIRRASIRQTMESVRFASKLGAKVVIIHPGRLPKDYPTGYLKNSRINLLTSLNVMARLAGRAGVVLALENSPRGRAHRLVATPQEHLYILSKSGSSYIGALLDVGHAATWGVDLREYLRLLGKHLLLLHLHDNRGGTDEHLPLGKGRVDIKGVGEEMGRLNRPIPSILCLRRRADFETSIKFLERMEHGRRWQRILRKKDHLKGSVV